MRRSLLPIATLVLLLSPAPGCVRISDAEWDFRNRIVVGGPDPDSCTPQTWYADSDGDGFGDPRGAVQDCVQPPATVDNYDDCDDTNPDLTDTVVWYRDEDGDGWGGDQTVDQCSQPPRYVSVPGDCDDTDASIHPDGTERCNGEDDDCDGRVDVDAVDETTWWIDRDGDGFGDPEGPLDACDPPLGYVDDASDCLDSDGSAYPGALEICGDGVDNDCDADPTDCQLQGEVDLTAEGLLLSGTASSRAGTSLALGDLTGDGIDDVVVGAPNVNALTGAVWLLAGPVEGATSLSGAYSLEGEAAADNAGWSLAPPSDLDGDGYADLLVGAWGNDEIVSRGGAAYVLSGPLTGGGGLADLGFALRGVATAERVGFSMAAAGDLTGDGAVDLLLGAYGRASAAGAAYVVHGPVTAEGDVGDATAFYGGTESRTGIAVAAAGDLTGDGLDDFIVGADRAEDAEGATPLNAGITYLVAGPVSAGAYVLSDVAQARILGMTAYEASGAALSAGDLTGDGLADILVGTGGYNTFAGAGTAWVVAGPLSGDLALASAATATLRGSNPGDAFGSAILAAGDVDADGSDDLLVGAPGIGGGAGAAYLFYGGLAGTFDAEDADATLMGGSGTATGSALGAGDATGDGVRDLLIGTPLGGVGGAILLPGVGQ